MIKFQRNYIAYIEIGERNADSQHQGIYTPQKVIEIKYPVTCIFNIDVGTTGSATRGTFQFYNLSKQVQAELWQDIYNMGSTYRRITFYAGYGDNTPLIFDGIINECTSERQPGAVDWITQMNAWDSGNFFQYGFLNMTVAKGATLADVIKYGCEKWGIKPGYISPKIPPLPQNTTFIGQAMDVIRQEYSGYNVYVDKGELNVLTDDEAIPGEVRIISDETGLLGSPKRANGFVEIETIFEPELRAKQAVTLLSNDIPWMNSVYSVVRIIHEGTISGTICDKLTTKATLSMFDKEVVEVQKSSGQTTTYGGTPTKGKWIKPTKTGRISSPYGWRVHPIKKTKHFHAAIDIKAPKDTPVYSPANGTVTFSAYKGDNGKLIIIDNGNNIQTYFLHLNQILVAKGDNVSQGQQIGTVGMTGSATGYHLDFRVKENGSFINPAKYIGKY